MGCGMDHTFPPTPSILIGTFLQRSLPLSELHALIVNNRVACFADQQEPLKPSVQDIYMNPGPSLKTIILFSFAQGHATHPDL